MTIDDDRALALVEELMAVPGRSGDEAAVAVRVAAELADSGVPAGVIAQDAAHTETGLTPPPGGTPCGNLSAVLPGRGTLADAPRWMLSAHLDTVPPCVGSEPVRVTDGGEDHFEAAGDTALGADDRAGVAAVLSGVRAVLLSGRDHPPLTLLFFVQEEVGVRGSRHADLSRLGDPELCLNFDGSDPAGVIVGATGQTELRVTVTGRAAHAGLAPETGVNALSVAAAALSALDRDGWHGKIERAGGLGTSNIGIVRGGEATNVVMPRLELVAEARSHDAAFRAAIVAAFREAFEAAAADRPPASVAFGENLKYDSFRLPADSPAVLAAEAAVRAAGHEPHHVVGNGGLDANWLTARGLPAATVGCGQRHVHTPAERLHVGDFLTACRVAAAFAAGG